MTIPRTADAAVDRAATPAAGPAGPLPYGRQWVDAEDEAAVLACLRDDRLTQGPRVEAFEEALREVTGAGHVVAVASGTAALHLACLAAGVGPGDAGVTSAVTFVASANCVAYCGGVPRFADIDPATGLVDTESLARLVRDLAEKGSPPKVIVPVDFAGQPADLPAVRAIADTVGAKVVADAAHSLGGTYRDEDGTSHRVGGNPHADLSILSFHPVKPVTTAEGGAVVTDDADLANRVRELRTHGIHRDPARLTRPHEGRWYYEQDALGLHYRISDLQCALGVSQLGKLEKFLTLRNERAAEYGAALGDGPLAGRVVPLTTRPGVTRHGYHLYVVRLVQRAVGAVDEPEESVAARRRAVYDGLHARGILAQVHYIPVPMQPYHGGNAAAFPGARAYYAGCLSLPMFPAMAAGDVDRVLAALGEALDEADAAVRFDGAET